MKNIGETFGDELVAAGCNHGVGFTVGGTEADIQYMDNADKSAVQVVIAAHNPIAGDLFDARQSSVNRMRSGCYAAATAGVTSNALGTDHIYPTTERDQGNMQAVVLKAQVHGSAKEPYKFWCADADGVWARREHTAAQIITAGDALFGHIALNQDKYELKLAGIAAASTQTELDLITWS